MLSCFEGNKALITSLSLPLRPVQKTETECCKSVHACLIPQQRLEDIKSQWGQNQKTFENHKRETKVINNSQSTALEWGHINLRQIKRNTGNKTQLTNHTWKILRPTKSSKHESSL
jgi:hypothetical protein